MSQHGQKWACPPGCHVNITADQSWRTATDVGMNADRIYSHWRQKPGAVWVFLSGWMLDCRLRLRRLWRTGLSNPSGTGVRVWLCFWFSPTAERKSVSSALKMLSCDLLLWSPSGYSLGMSRKCIEGLVLMKLNQYWVVERNISLCSWRNLWLL